MRPLSGSRPTLPRTVACLAAGLILAALCVALPYQGGATRLSLGSMSSAPALDGFYQPELAPDGTAFRWSQAQGVITFGHVGVRPLRLRLYAHALRPQGIATVIVGINGREVDRFPAGGAFAEHDLTLDPSRFGWNGELQISLRATPFVAPPDTRQLGVAVAWVELDPLFGVAAPPARVLFPLLLATAWLVLARRPARIPLPQPLSLTLGLLPVGLVGLLRLWPLLPWVWIAPLAVWAGPVAVSLVPRFWHRLRRWLGRLRARHPQAFWLVLMAGVALAVYLPLATTTGYWGDIEIYMAWTWQATHSGIHSVYAPSFVAPPNTTPLLLYPFRLAGEVFRALWSPSFPPPWLDRTNQGYLRFLLRLPALASTGLIAAAAYKLVLKHWGKRWALIAVAAYLFNPAVVFESAYYGQTGAVHSLFMLLAVAGLTEGYPGWGWVALALGMLTKPQADVFLPLMAILTWRRYGPARLTRALLAALACALVVLAPFITCGTLGEMWARVSRPESYHPMLSATAHNFWWFASLGQGRLSDLAHPLGLPLLNYRLIGLGLFGLAYLLVLLRTWKDSAAAVTYESFAFLFLSFFMLATQIHENHLIPMFSLLLLAMPGDRRLRWLYAAFAVTATLNMALHYPQIIRVLAPTGADVWGGPALALPRWLNAAAQVGLYAWWATGYVRSTYPLLLTTLSSGRRT